MIDKGRTVLTILLYSYEKEGNSLFKALSSINNQVGCNLKGKLRILLLINNKNVNQQINFAFFENLNIDLFIRKNKNYATLVNEALKTIHTEWVTFMDSRDLLFADGSLLDFFSLSNDPKNRTDILIFKYLIPNINNDQIIDFTAIDYLNFPFGKYFKLSFLQNNSIFFNEQLKHYLLEDFTSRAVEICKKPIWVNLINYYLTPRTSGKDDLNEFVRYRLTFLDFIQKNNVTGQTYLRDLAWSIVRAFYILEDQDLFNILTDKRDFLSLVNLVRPFNNYKDKLIDEFKQQRGSHKMGFSQFEDFLRGNKE